MTTIPPFSPDALPSISPEVIDQIIRAILSRTQLRDASGRCVVYSGLRAVMPENQGTYLCVPRADYERYLRYVLR